MASSASAASAPRLDVYAGDVPREQLEKIVALGVDRHELEISKARSGGKDTVHVETIISAQDAAQLEKEGVALEPKEIDGATVAERATRMAADGMEVFRPYSGTGGLKQEFERAAADNPRIAKLINLGKTHNDEDIIGIKLTLDARQTRDGAKPATLYIGAQHAREWITPEMNRRLMHYLIDSWRARDQRIRRLLRNFELWIVPVANPDGYDFSFTEGQRLWRKNLRDNDGDGQITGADGVDLNRNFDYRWGYDNEGSSPEPSIDTYRGPSPNSEPESQALDRLVARVRFEFFVNYHSAAELLLYGVGWQVATPSPDDVIGETLAGDDAEPAVPGYDPDLSAELYTTNGDTDTYMQEKYGSYGFTPEMSTCEAASDSVPDDEWEAEDCGSGFEFPDDEALVETEFQNNLPFALSVAESADDPANPESVVGREAEDFRVDSFAVSYGDPQTVAVTAKRELRRKRMHYRIGNGRTRTAPVQEWIGGERYGYEMKRYYAEYRGEVSGASAGQRVTVWFSGEERRNNGQWRDVLSEPFTYTVKQDTGAQVLVIADEDYKGTSPTYPAGTNAPLYGQAHLDAVRSAGYTADLWDVDVDGVPHDLGVLDHYDAIVWYLGDNVLTQDPEDEFIDTGGLTNPDPLFEIGVAERAQYLTLAVRDFLNEGGKLVHMGEFAQYGGLFDQLVGGTYYGLNGDPTAECRITTGPQGLFDDCLILANDFRQYYLGAYTRVGLGGADSVAGIAEPIEGYQAMLGATPTNELDQAGVFQPTSDVLPPEQFPQFTSRGAAEYNFAGGPFTPVEGSRYAAAVHQDESYMRLTKAFNLGAVTAAQTPQLRFQLSLDSETRYDHLIVEARRLGSNDWTTLPEAGGRSINTVPAECNAGYLLALHPKLRHYLTGPPNTPGCTNTGTTGAWNAITGSTNGWQQVAYDLSAYAGSVVEIHISYVTDPSTGGIGAFVDDTRLAVGGVEQQKDGFESRGSSWLVQGEPEGSPPTVGNWVFGAQAVNFFAGTSTEDTLLLGFGLEHVTAPADRTTLMRRALGGLGVGG
ncbi:M14 family metallopeptidase [Solirubrobacter deserti]|uniref:M14 family zinc carboxypeptidase n=1 Tax=Solirubrobacter deserti TaxID=2282478 RepID=A0ABT4RV82_9ACTN|nr:M14 family metallopeptidase [Solirubrobacter deserti]MDA0142176.1 M14 family zinc carboxypeptidase [Solirubrobacter deserti]